jgi:Ca2+/Na+ antiporter
MKLFLSRRLQFITAIVISNLLFFSFVNPVESNSPLLAVGFLLLSLDIYLIVRTILMAVRLVRNQKSQPDRRIVFLVTATCVLLLALQSIGELSVRDGVALAMIAIIVMFYLSFYRPKRQL